ncbi:MAG: iron chaperone [Candidatus Saccharimonadales bacterium]
MNQQAKSVDEYIALQPPAAQKPLRQLRQLIRQSAPDAKEKLSYGLPYYYLNGRLVYFGGFKNHISLFPLKSGITAFQKQLQSYQTSAGTVKFPLDKPLPLELIKKIIDYRVEQNLQK